MLTRLTIKISPVFVFFLLLGFLLSCSAIFCSVKTVNAATRYVKPSAEVVVRTGQGNEYKIISMVKDGAAVDLLQENDAYAMIRLPDGREGWMLKRFLSADPPLSVVVASLRAENEKMKQREMEQARQVDEISATLKKTESELASIVTERDQVKTDFQNLQEDTADVILIKEDMLKATKENELLAQEMAMLKEENNKLNKDKSINWFLAGGGVLLVGMFIGRLSSASRKRKSSLL
ncbi:TIGR04211 family SH3 domain-containing protein [Desulfocastanea catecholica]